MHGTDCREAKSEAGNVFKSPVTAAFKATSESFLSLGTLGIAGD